MAKNSWDEGWIHFSKKARRGIIVLLLLFIIVAVSPRFYYNYIHTPSDYGIKISPLDTDAQDSTYVEASRYHAPEDPFDPNTYSLEEWMAVGLSEKQANSILKYLGSGAKLKVKSDLKKLYVIDDELYALLVPKIDLPESTDRKKTNKQLPDQDEKRITSVVHKETEITPVSINRASSRALQSIPGIGPFFAKEIIRIRESYGGIISSDQLLDIYKIEERLEDILPYLIIDSSEVNKLNVNTASEEQLRQHPLISRDMAKSIVYFRENHREYKSLEELLLSPYIDSEVLLRISPFLKVE